MAVVSNARAAEQPSAGTAGAKLRTGAWNIVSLAAALMLWQLAALLVASPFFPPP